MSKNLDKAIAYCMHALKKADPSNREDLQRALAYVNATRILAKAGDQGLASACLAKCVEILKSLETVEESIPADRMARASSASTTNAAQRNAWMGSGRRQETGFAAAEPESRSDAPITPSRPSKVFGKRRN